MLKRALFLGFAATLLLADAGRAQTTLSHRSRDGLSAASLLMTDPPPATHGPATPSGHVAHHRIRHGSPTTPQASRSSLPDEGGATDGAARSAHAPDDSRHSRH